MTICPLHPQHDKLLDDHEKRLRKLEESQGLPSAFWLGLFGFLGALVSTLGPLLLK